MLLAGIVGQEDMMKTVGLINSILASTGKKISVADSAGLVGMDMKRIRNYMSELEKNRIDVLLLKMNRYNLEKLLLNGVNFDIMIFTGNLDAKDTAGQDSMAYISGKLQSFMGDKGITIVNVDDRELITLLEGKLQHIVTYGFNSEASITTSSIMDTLFDGSLLLCLQRTIPARNGRMVEPQEYKLKLEPGEFDTHNILAAVSFAIVNGVDLNNLSYI